MWIIESSNGITSTSLLNVLLKLEDSNNQYLFDNLQLCLKTENNIFSSLTLSDLSLDNVFQVLSAKFHDLPIMDEDSILRNSGSLMNTMKNILTISQQKTLDSFELFVYISLLILLDKYFNSNKLCFFVPKIGINSSTVSLALIKNKKIHLSEGLAPLPKLLAAIMNLYMFSFINDISIELLDIIEIIDPFDNKLVNRIFVGKDSVSNSDNSVCVLETNIDDTTPEIMAGAMDHILSMGALDYIVIPGMMKKNRMGFQIQVLCEPKDTDNIINHLFKWTSTFGIRKTIVNRVILERRIDEIETSMGRVRIKKGFYNNRIIRTSPEFDDILRISKETGDSVQNIYSLINYEINLNSGSK